MPEFVRPKNVLHNFESIVNARTPLEENPITNDLMQERWTEFGPSTVGLGWRESVGREHLYGVQYEYLIETSVAI